MGHHADGLGSVSVWSRRGPAAREVGHPTVCGTTSVARLLATIGTLCLTTLSGCGGESNAAGESNGAGRSKGAGESNRFAEYEGTLAGPLSTTAKCAAQPGDTVLIAVRSDQAAQLLWNPTDEAPCASRLGLVGQQGAWFQVPAGTRVRVLGLAKREYANGVPLTYAVVQRLEARAGVPERFIAPEDYVRR